LSQFFPLPDTYVLHPLAFAGWVGLFVTAINLLPAGQLDGGHVARALLGRRQFYVSWAAILILFGMSVFYPGWFIFGFLIFMLGVRHPPPLNDITRLDPARKLVGIAAIVILLVTFVPQPFVVVGNQRDFSFETPAGAPLSELNITIALGGLLPLRFALNNTGLARDTFVVTVNRMNLDRLGFVIRLTGFEIDGTPMPVSAEPVTISLNTSQRAILNLSVEAPSSWPVPLPAYVEFLIHATILDDAVSRDLRVALEVTN
ncbi:MAG: site-2 protease family protein, partial [Thermoplasmata archaeon]